MFDRALTVTVAEDLFVEEAEGVEGSVDDTP